MCVCVCVCACVVRVCACSVLCYVCVFVFVFVGVQICAVCARTCAVCVFVCICTRACARARIYGGRKNSLGDVYFLLYLYTFEKPSVEGSKNEKNGRHMSETAYPWGEVLQETPRTKLWCWWSVKGISLDKDGNADLSSGVSPRKRHVARVCLKALLFTGCSRSHC